MTSNHTFLLNPFYSSTNLNDKHIARLGPSLTNPRNNFGQRNDMLYFCYYYTQHIEKQLVIQFLLMFCSQGPPSPSGVDALINPFAVFLPWPFPQSLAPPSLHSPSSNLVPMLFPSHGILTTSPNTPCLGTATCPCSRLSKHCTPWFSTSSGTGRNTCLHSGLTESSKYFFSNETWNTGCTLISGGNANL